MQNDNIPAFHATVPTEAELAAAHEAFMTDLRESPNNLSFWFPKIRDCGIRVPGTTVIPVPEDVVVAFFGDEGEEDMKRILAYVEEKVMPVVDAMPGLPFIKNGCFSDKFRFSLCCPPDKRLSTILRSVIGIQGDSLAYDTMGAAELVIRERIPSPDDMPRIYGGMPLNCEFRVFYDFDEHKALYVMNYWDRDYCRDAVADKNPSDGKAFDERWPSLDGEYRANAETVFREVSAAMEDVSGLRGTWSIDILRDAEGVLWLIDMAVASQSAYWDPYKAGLCRLYAKMDEFITAAGCETPADTGRRRHHFDEYRFRDDFTYRAMIQDVFVRAYAKPRFGTELKGDEAQFFNTWSFIEREIPRTDDNIALMKHTEECESRAFGPERHTGEYVEYWGARWNQALNALFLKAAAAFLTEQT